MWPIPTPHGFGCGGASDLLCHVLDYTAPISVSVPSLDFAR